MLGLFNEALPPADPGGLVPVLVDAYGRPLVVLTDADGAAYSGANPLPVRDQFISGEILADQAGAGAVLTFTFSSAVQFVSVRCDGGDARVDPYGGTPSATLGIVCDDGVALQRPVPSTTAIKVYAPAASTVSVDGARY